jgi:hypothetical protein
MARYALLGTRAGYSERVAKRYRYSNYAVSNVMALCNVSAQAQSEYTKGFSRASPSYGRSLLCE